MIERVLADGIVVLHAAFVLFVAFGGFAVIVRSWIAWLHLPAACWGTLVALCGWTCPLTPLEVSLRRAAGDAGYAGGFIEHYLVALIYPPGLTRELQVVLGIMVVVINLLAYTIVMRRRSG